MSTFLKHVTDGLSNMWSYFATPVVQVAHESAQAITNNAPALAQAGAAAAVIKLCPTNVAVATVAAQVFTCNKQKMKAEDELKSFKSAVRQLSEHFSPLVELDKIAHMSFTDKNNFFKQWELILEYIPISKLPEEVAPLRCMITDLLPINPIFLYVTEQECPMQDRFPKYQNMPEGGYCFDFHSFFIYYTDYKKCPWEVSAGKTKFIPNEKTLKRFFMPNPALKQYLIHAAASSDNTQ